MICGVPKCNHTVKKYGVCGRHKRWYFMSDDPVFNSLINRYKLAMTELVEENKRLKSLGIDVQRISECWDGNINGPRKHEFPPEFKMVGFLIEAMDDIHAELKANFNAKLVYNTTLMARHQAFGNCKCLNCVVTFKEIDKKIN